MRDLARVVAQVEAHRRRRAMPVRATSALSADSTRAFGIAPIRVVAEQRVQAIASGVIGLPAQVVTIWNPLSRDTGQLEPFAEALNEYLVRETEPRIWLPHPAALEIVDLLGHRYATNRNASHTLRRMGAQCRVIVDEASFTGQQVVAIASQLLTEHVATGQSPVEDQHLGALLAWVASPPGTDVFQEAARRALLPAAAMLHRSVDDRVETLRRTAKAIGTGAAAARAEIERLLEAGARAEWELLVEARAAFWALGLPPMPRIATLVTASRARFAYAIRELHSRPVMPDTLGRLLDDQELALNRAEDIAVRSDASVLERLRLKGKAVRVVLVERVQPRRNFNPCVLRFYTRQDVLRIRAGTTLQTLDGAITGRVIAVQSPPPRRGTLVEFRVTAGVRAASALRQLGRLDLVDTVVVDMSRRKGDAYRRLRASGPPLVYGDALPPAGPRSLPSTPLDMVAADLRNP